MLSSDKSVESIAQLIELVKHHVGLEAEYLKFDVVAKLVRLSAALITFVIALIFIVLVLFYLSFALVYWIAPLTGQGTAFAIVAALFLIILIAVMAKRKAWIERPLVKVMANILLNE